MTNCIPVFYSQSITDISAVIVGFCVFVFVFDVHQVLKVFIEFVTILFLPYVLVFEP